MKRLYRVLLVSWMAVLLGACAASGPPSEPLSVEGAGAAPAAGGAESAAQPPAAAPAPAADQAPPVAETIPLGEDGGGEAAREPDTAQPESVAGGAAPAAPVAITQEAAAPVEPVEKASLAPLPAAAGVRPTPVPGAAAAPRRPRTVVADTTPRTFTVKAGRKDASHPFYQRGSELGFIVDGAQGKELVLTRGVSYAFNVDTGVQHDFYFSTAPVGRGAGTVTQGVEGQFTYQGEVDFTPGDETPATVYYACRNHKYMGGKIHVVNAGEKVTVDKPLAAPVSARGRKTVSAASVRQKLNYAAMLLAPGSATAARIADSGNAAALAQLDQSKERYSAAKTALGAGNNAAALAAADASIRAFNAAARMVPDQSAVIDHEQRYEQLLAEVSGFYSSYEKNIERGLKPKEGKALDTALYHRLVREGKNFAAQNEYGAAVSRLSDASDLLTAALGSLLDSQTVVYDKNFANAAEEYEYELARYGSYRDLIPVAKEQLKPSPGVVGLMDRYVARAREIRAEGVALAEKGDHKSAIMALQAATKKLRLALRLVGVQ
ncbi:MAG TPA: hypothetical protein ENJ19_08830 [Gammaproteobacteria bacterium]|nr:hypothetical protein [Gammaproteobacteria bacterium]